MSLTLKERFAVLERDGFVCRYCGRRPPHVELEVDHVHPRSKGGTDEPKNLVAACFECNSGKRDQIVPPSAEDLYWEQRLVGAQMLFLWCTDAFGADECAGAMMREGVRSLPRTYRDAGRLQDAIHRTRLWLETVPKADRTVTGWQHVLRILHDTATATEAGD